MGDDVQLVSIAVWMVGQNSWPVGHVRGETRGNISQRRFALVHAARLHGLSAQLHIIHNLTPVYRVISTLGVFRREQYLVIAADVEQFPLNTLHWTCDCIADIVSTKVSL